MSGLLTIYGPANRSPPEATILQEDLGEFDLQLQAARSRKDEALDTLCSSHRSARLLGGFRNPSLTATVFTATALARLFPKIETHEPD